METRQVFEYHSTIGYRYIPLLKVRIPHEGGGYLFHTNSSGFRCRHEFSKYKSSLRILLFGDSFTAGEGVSDGKRFSDILEKNVSGVEVFNFGLPGTGTDQQYLAYQEYAKNLPSDLLILSVFIDNIRRVVARHRVYLNDSGEQVYYAKPYYVLNDRGDVLLQGIPPEKQPISISSFNPHSLRYVDRGGRFPRLRSLLIRTGLKDRVQKITKYQPLPEYNSADNAAWQLMKAILSNWITRHAGPVVLMPIPQYQYIEDLCDSNPYQARFRELATETGCYLHDPLSDLRQYNIDDRRSFRFAHDVHMTSQGHAALAASLTPAVKAILKKSSPLSHA